MTFIRGSPIAPTESGVMTGRISGIKANIRYGSSVRVDRR